mmetsp:Transcript_18441/g.69866  ORF Transcript_18441/g.69866 Transcript_18441/m.69866 type:complete len:234 (+) Transcript_18441:279-980(+)
MCRAKWHAAAVHAMAGLARPPADATTPSTPMVTAGSVLLHPPREHEHSTPRQNASREPQTTSSSDLGLALPIIRAAMAARKARATVAAGAYRQFPGTKAIGTSRLSELVMGGHMRTWQHVRTPKAKIRLRSVRVMADGEASESISTSAATPSDPTTADSERPTLRFTAREATSMAPMAEALCASRSSVKRVCALVTRPPRARSHGGTNWVLAPTTKHTGKQTATAIRTENLLQ